MTAWTELLAKATDIDFDRVALSTSQPERVERVLDLLLGDHRVQASRRRSRTAHSRAVSRHRQPGGGAAFGRRGRARRSDGVGPLTVRARRVNARRSSRDRKASPGSRRHRVELDAVGIWSRAVTTMTGVGKGTELRKQRCVGRWSEGIKNRQSREGSARSSASDRVPRCDLVADALRCLLSSTSRIRASLTRSAQFCFSC